jgi:hypothetical protein
LAYTLAHNRVAKPGGYAKPPANTDPKIGYSLKGTITESESFASWSAGWRVSIGTSKAY